MLPIVRASFLRISRQFVPASFVQTRSIFSIDVGERDDVEKVYGVLNNRIRNSGLVKRARFKERYVKKKVRRVLKRERKEYYTLKGKVGKLLDWVTFKQVNRLD